MRFMRYITQPTRLFWLVLFLTTWVLSANSFSLYKAFSARWIIRFPKRWEIPLADWISAAMDWFVFYFSGFTRFLASLVEWPYQVVRSALIDGFATGQGQQAVEIVPALSWIAIIVVLVAMALYAKGWRLAVLVGLCFLYLAVFGQWHSAMITLASILIAVPLGTAGGLFFGILSYRSKTVERILRPFLDLMQTVPVFAYLVPILFLFGFGPVSALVATMIYAMPPMVRVSTVALQTVPIEVIEAGTMAGCTRHQMLWKVLIPSAMPTLMVGVNQVIMLSLNMVIIASMIGAGGLGYDVLTALRRLDIGGGIEAGMAIVVMAVALDRLSQAFARKTQGALPQPGLSFHRRHPWLVTVGLIVLGLWLAGMAIPVVQSYPDNATLTTGTFWTETMKWININFFDTLEAIKVFFLTYLMLPVKHFFVGIPWAWGILATGLAAWRVGGLKLGFMAALMALFIASNGLWGKAMITVYLCGVSVLVASVVGIPLGIWAGQNQRVNSVVGAFIDTLQTLPSFVYLIPVIMLFRVGDFSAMIAMILYALAPAVRYAAHGIREVPPQMIEAGKVSGCTKWQLLWRIKLPMATPSLLLGLNQTIMLAISMLVITALVGTRDLGQEVYIALTKANTGSGVIAGLSVAFIAITADRIISALAQASRERLGLE